MKGVIFNLLEEVVVDEFGIDMWEDLIDDTGLTGAYNSLGNYADADIEALVVAAGRRLDLQPGQVLQWFGQRAMPLLKRRYPDLFKHSSSRDFILSVNHHIHPEVRKLYAGAACPFFHFKTAGSDAIVVRYQSSRKLIDLAHGFVLGAAALWGETITVLRGDAGAGRGDELTIHWGAVG